MGLWRKLFPPKHKHNFKLFKYDNSKGDATCQCSGWKTFHDSNSPAGNCGNFRPRYYGIERCDCGATGKEYIYTTQGEIKEVKDGVLESLYMLSR